MNELKSYLEHVRKELRTGAATEHTYRPALKELVESLDEGVIAINEPKHVDCGAPDFVVKKGDFPVGYIEAKDIGKSLDEAERSEQLERYLGSLDNLILTDYLEFRWYQGGELRETARLARRSKDGKVVVQKNGLEEAGRLLESFLDQTPEPIRSSKDLSSRLARLAHIIRDMIVEAFEKDVASSHLWNLRRAFAEVLIPDMNLPKKTPEFADMYAQTIVYGLFAARCNHKGPESFQRLGAAREIPKTNPFLRQLFETVTGNALDDEPYVNYVEDLVLVLANTDIDTVLADFGKRTKQEDPVVHFYETFLAAYDPKLRVKRGVYYTPEPVVSYIVRSVDHILKTRFNLGGGLMDSSKIDYDRQTYALDSRGKPDPERLPTRIVQETIPKVLILDPACGTGTFLYAVIDHIRSDFMDHGNAGLWSNYVRDHLLPRIFGFELLMASYAVAHFKLGMQLAGQDLPEDLRDDWVYDFASDERLGIYLTNTLEEAENPWKNLWGYEVVGEEARSASVVKRDYPIMVVLGNPPYSGHSANSSWEIVDGKKKTRNFIGKLLQDYYKVDGKPLGERNPKWLQDDYVKFIRWAQWRIEQTGSGVVGLITNHGYLDNPTFRGMRQQLMAAFSEIYILDLHGNAKKKERAPDGSKDENVFDIQQGVAIGIFVKTPEKNGPAKVYHSELWGRREEKYQSLLDASVNTTEWVQLEPQSPFYLFIRQDVRLKAEYQQGWRVTEIHPINVLGFQTHRDHFAINFDQNNIYERLLNLRNESLSNEVLREQYKLRDNRDWKLSHSRKLLQQDPNWDRHILRCLYRPFDWRWCYFSKAVMDYPRRELMDNVKNLDNICLLSSRQQAVPGYRHSWVSNVPANDCVISTTSREANQVFPLYLYPTTDGKSSRQKSLDSAEWPPGKDGRVPNLSPEFVADFAKKLGLEFVSDGKGDLESTFGPEDVFCYIYAVFHSPTYRERYAEFLKIDFPRVPLTSDPDLFRRLCALGADLTALHLLEAPQLSESITCYPIPGDNLVDRPKYFAPGDCLPKKKEALEAGRVYINKTQYLEGVDPEVWEFQVGGYQVCAKWLKDRKGRKLSYDDLTTYQRIVVALKETIRLMAKIDEAIPEWPMG